MAMDEEQPEIGAKSIVNSRARGGQHGFLPYFHRTPAAQLLAQVLMSWQLKRRTPFLVSPRTASSESLDFAPAVNSALICSGSPSVGLDSLLDP
jgi:hypothetical protein